MHPIINSGIFIVFSSNVRSHGNNWWKAVVWNEKKKSENCSMKLYALKPSTTLLFAISAFLWEKKGT
jgi:hypothetical protein